MSERWEVKHSSMKRVILRHSHWWFGSRIARRLLWPLLERRGYLWSLLDGDRVLIIQKQGAK